MSARLGGSFVRSFGHLFAKKPSDREREEEERKREGEKRRYSCGTSSGTDVKQQGDPCLVRAARKGPPVNFNHSFYGSSVSLDRWQPINRGKLQQQQNSKQGRKCHFFYKASSAVFYYLC